MIDELVVDTGPLVAALDRREPFHPWAVAALGGGRAPVWVCEAVLVEAAWLLRDVAGGREALGAALARGAVAIRFSLRDEHTEVFGLLDRYRNVPMSLADGCVVRMSELNPGATVLTTDSDFEVYRRFRRERIPTLRPE